MLYSHLLPGSKRSGARAEELHVVVEGLQLEAVCVELGAEEVAGAAGVREQMTAP